MPASRPSRILEGKRVNIGNPGSGQRGTMEVLMEAYGWDMDTFSQVSELQSSEQSQALCDNNIDAFVFTVGHPSGSIQEATTSCDTVLVEVQSDIVDQLIEENSYYAYSTIPGGMYEGNPEDTTTFGVKATFVTSTALSEDVVYEIVKAVFENFDAFRSLHPGVREPAAGGHGHRCAVRPAASGRAEVLRGAGLDVTRPGGA